MIERKWESGGSVTTAHRMSRLSCREKLRRKTLKHNDNDEKNCVADFSQIIYRAEDFRVSFYSEAMSQFFPYHFSVVDVSKVNWNSAWCYRVWPAYWAAQWIIDCRRECLCSVECSRCFVKVNRKRDSWLTLKEAHWWSVWGSQLKTCHLGLVDGGLEHSARFVMRCFIHTLILRVVWATYMENNCRPTWIWWRKRKSL